MFHKLSDDVIATEIFASLDAPDLIAVMDTSKRLKELASREALWRGLVQRELSRVKDVAVSAKGKSKAKAKARGKGQGKGQGSHDGKVAHYYVQESAQLFPGVWASIPIDSIILILRAYCSFVRDVKLVGSAPVLPQLPDGYTEIFDEFEKMHLETFPDDSRNFVRKFTPFSQDFVDKMMIHVGPWIRWVWFAVFGDCGNFGTEKLQRSVTKQHQFHTNDKERSIHQAFMERWSAEVKHGCPRTSKSFVKDFGFKNCVQCLVNPLPHKRPDFHFVPIRSDNNWPTLVGSFDFYQRTSRRFFETLKKQPGVWTKDQIAASLRLFINDHEEEDRVQRCQQPSQHGPHIYPKYQHAKHDFDELHLPVDQRQWRILEIEQEQARAKVEKSSLFKRKAKLIHQRDSIIDEIDRVSKQIENAVDIEAKKIRVSKMEKEHKKQIAKHSIKKVVKRKKTVKK